MESSKHLFRPDSAVLQQLGEGDVPRWSRLPVVGMEMYLLCVVNNRSDAKRGMKAESLLKRDGVKKINPDGPGLMLVGREMLQRGGRTSRFGIGFFFARVS